MSQSPQRADIAKVERFAMLLAGCQRQVFLYLMGLLHHAADAEEALQETNLVLWRKFDEYRSGTEFGRWACSVAHYEALKVREKHLQQRRLFSDAFIARLADTEPPAADLLDARREALTHCLEKLSDADRKLVLARYQTAAKTRSVAEALGRSFQGTRRTLHRIRTALLGCIERRLAQEGVS